MLIISLRGPALEAVVIQRRSFCARLSLMVMGRRDVLSSNIDDLSF
jgi:hypothetical protein